MTKIHDSFDTQGTMTLDELNRYDTTDNTTDTVGRKKHRRTKKKRITKKRITKKRNGKKGRKTRKHKQRGGTCYGNGVGSNRYDPNYSIYNTNMLKLFPYKST